RGIIFLAQREQPVLHDAGRHLIEGTHLVERNVHTVGDRLDQLVVVDLPTQPLSDHPGDGAAPGAGLATDADVLEPRRRAGDRCRRVVLLTPAEEPAHHEMRPDVQSMPTRTVPADSTR